MSDLISREAAIEEIHKYFMSELDKEETHMQDGREVYTNMPHMNELLTHNKQISIKIKSLPTAEKVGKWIYKEIDDETGIDDHEFCSECGFPMAQIYGNFCAVCGARMRGEEDGKQT